MSCGPDGAKQRAIQRNLRIEDYRFDYNGSRLRYRSASKVIEQSQYRLHIDDGWKKEVFYVTAGTSLKEALAQYGLPL